jgi:hypothetical protein
MKGNVHIFFVVVLLLIFTGCGNSNVDLIKDSTFNNDSTVNIGKTLGHLFSGGDWDSKDNDGRTVVSFSGKIKQSMHEEFDKELDKLTISERLEYYAEKIPEIGSEYEKSLGLLNKKIKEYVVANEKEYNLVKKYQLGCNFSLDDLNSSLLTYDHGAGRKICNYSPNLNGSILIEKYTEEENKGLENALDEVIKTKTAMDNSKEISQELLAELYSKSSLVEDEIKSKHDRFCSQTDKLADKYNQGLKELQEELSIAEQEIVPQLVEKISEKYYFPTGSDVKFEWTIYPSGDKFKFTDISCETIEEGGCTQLYFVAVGNSM